MSSLTYKVVLYGYRLVSKEMADKAAKEAKNSCTNVAVNVSQSETNSFSLR